MDFRDIEAAVERCEKCGLYRARNKVVVGDGGINSRILFIGEAPGRMEDEEGRTFVGRSGQLLEKMLSDIGLDKNKDVYITNIVKCRPPKNRDPRPEEQEACIPFLREQYKLLRPKIVVCLGRVAAQRIIDKKFSITRQHGTWVSKCGVYFTATFHPSALLRYPDNMQYAKEDFKSIKKKISELR